jgi:hypothetical protein
MKRFIFIIGLIFGVFPAVTSAQESTNPLVYGDEIEADITNQNFEAIYTFKGEKGDVVVITMIADSDSTLDPYLYLTTLENEVVAQNDDFFNLNSRIIARLPEGDTYQIVATRLGERTGDGEGRFTLTLESIPVTSGDITVEGTAAPTNTPPTHVFVLETSGSYAITYTIVRGDYFPALVVERVNAETFYNEAVATIGGNGLQRGTVILNLEADELYIVSLQDNYYTTPTTDTVYTVRVELQDE